MGDVRPIGHHRDGCGILVAAALLATGMAVIVPGIVLATPASALPGDLRLASSRADGVKGNGESSPSETSLSADGTVVAFSSVSTNLSPSDADIFDDVYVKNVATGVLTLASVNAAGVKGNSYSGSWPGRPSLSDDGGKVAFHSRASNLLSADHDSNFDVYVKDLATGSLILASATASGIKGNGESANPVLSPDGTKVAFQSMATNLVPADTDTKIDVYVKDLVTGAISLTSVNATGTKGNDQSTPSSLSFDGSKVSFWTYATNLDPGDTDSLVDVYVKNLATGTLTLASVTQAGSKGNDGSFESSLSADGEKVAFETSSTNFDPIDNDPNVADVYVKDLTTGALTLASITQAGVKAASGPFTGSSNPSLSADGTRVAFESIAGNLDPSDTDFTWDVYVKNLVTGTLTLTSTTATGLKGNNGSGGPSLSADGSTVAFVSLATNLDPADTDNGRDVYTKQVKVANHSPGAPDAVVSVTDCAIGTPFDPAASDPDNDPLTYVFGATILGAVGGTLPPFTYTPKAGVSSGTDTFTYTVDDGRGGSATGTITVTIACNHPPTAADVTVTVKKNSVNNPIVLAGVDPDGDNLSYTYTTPLHGTITGTGQNVAYTPTHSFIGTDSFTYTVDDGRGGTATATVTVTVKKPHHDDDDDDKPRDGRDRRPR